MATKSVDMLIRPIPPSLKDAVEAEARARGTSAGNLAVEILAESFGIAFKAKPLTRSMRVESNREILYLQMPRTLRRRIKARAGAKDTNASDVARAILLDYFNLAHVASNNTPAEKEESGARER